MTGYPKTGRYAKLQSAETVLGVLRDRGRRGLPCNELFRQLFNPQMYLLAYGRLYSNHGAMTPGVDGETADGMSLAKIGRVIDALRHERFRFQPARRVYIPKKNGARRPLGMPPWSDKLVGEVIRLLLEAYYEPRFSDRSHGFRPGRGCHTALSEVADKWTGTTWFIEGDISDCFGSFDHQVMLSALAEKIRDNRFLRLIKQMLQAGYLEDWVWNATLSGAPQGGVVSPILRKRGDLAAAREMRKQQRSLPSVDPRDPGYRRLRYCRYADDTLLGFTGPKAEAEQIRQRLAQFLREDLKLELNPDKTLITHARTQAAAFLGYEITVQHSATRPAVNGSIALRVPKAVIKAKCAPYLKRGKPARRTELMNQDDHVIISTYGAEYRGLVQYYLLAGDVWRLSRLQWVTLTSLLKTLGARHRSTVAKMARKYGATVDTPHGPRRCFEARVERAGRKPLVARFGGIPLKRQKQAVLQDRQPVPVTGRKELITRLQAGRCELCEERARVEVHQVRKLADLTRPGRPQPAWAHLMAKMRRKTLIVCFTCHNAIHARQPAAIPTE